MIELPNIKTEVGGDTVKQVFRSGRNKKASIEFDGTTLESKINDVIISEIDADGVNIDTLAVDNVTEKTSGSGVIIDGVLIKDGSITSTLSPVVGFPIWNGVDPSDWIMFMDDFINTPIDDDDVVNGITGYQVVTDAIGTTGMIDELGGWIGINATNTDNNETYLASASEAFKFDTDKKLIFKCRIKLAEVNTDDANWIIGLSSVAAANTLVDDGAGVVTTYDGAVFYKVDGNMRIMFESSNAGDQVDNATLATFVTDTTYNLAFIYDYGNGTTGSITPYVNGVAGTAHAITIAGLEEMHLIMGVKAGTTGAETLKVDYVAVTQERR